jgi:uridine kinase
MKKKKKEKKIMSESDIFELELDEQKANKEKEAKSEGKNDVDDQVQKASAESAQKKSKNKEKKERKRQERREQRRRLAEESEQRRESEPLIIGVSGGTASGKTSVCKAITDRLSDQRIALITLDSYYRQLSDDEKTLVSRKQFNFDAPEAFDWPLVRRHIRAIRKQRPVHVPVYDYVTHSRCDSAPVSNVDVVFFEGILAFHDDDVREQLDMKIFVDTDADIRLARRVVRDIEERGRQLDGILDQYENSVKPSFEKYILPTKKYADVIIPRGASNRVAVDLFADHVRFRLDSTAAARASLSGLLSSSPGAGAGSSDDFLRDIGRSSASDESVGHRRTGVAASASSPHLNDRHLPNGISSPALAATVDGSDYSALSQGAEAASKSTSGGSFAAVALFSDGTALSPRDSDRWLERRKRSVSSSKADDGD